MRIKSPPCCQLHHDPENWPGVCVSLAAGSTLDVPRVWWFGVVALRIELSAARVSAELGQPALDYQLSRHARTVGREALESSSAVLQTAARPSQLPAHVVICCPFNLGTKKGSRSQETSSLDEGTSREVDVTFAVDRWVTYLSGSTHRAHSRQTRRHVSVRVD